MLAQELAAETGEVDLLIRTGGEKRLSDFLLWECAYAELWFTDRMWPDFEPSDLDAALAEFHLTGPALWRGARVVGGLAHRRWAMIAPGSRPVKVKFILPALKEASDPYWLPIKYSLFPPLGLATLAAYLSADDHAVIVDEHVEPLTIDDAPELVVIQVYITNAYRAYRIADRYRSQGAFVVSAGCMSLPCPTKQPFTQTPSFSARENKPSQISAGLSCRQARAGLHLSDRPYAGACAAGSPRSHPARAISGAEFHCGDARLPPALRLLL